MYQVWVLDMDAVNDFPEDGPLPRVIVYDNKTNDSSTATSAVSSKNDSIENTDLYVSIAHDA